MTEHTDPGQQQTKRVDLLLVAEMIAPGSRVLDVGCGDGTLLRILENRYGIDGRGIELSQRGVNECVAKGLAVVQGDADHDLDDYPDNGFDYVILSQTVQATRNPRVVLGHLLRIGRRAIVSFPNFGHWRMRWQLLFEGRMPVTEHLPMSWYDTPNIHFCTIRDFVSLVHDLEARIERTIALDSRGRRLPDNASLSRLNIFGEQAIFLLRRGGEAD
ncbi:methionine biosynthesis protein MetW [Tepidamorphus gemmatus]|jgi:methionine biosynthesis protein MetW|uniref:Methionine biosynthesis protein MetW n=1 Tax=Tepidamorphus gemmatus TaxID=747076 RepID=A0A4R3MF59_9HYPH|nr:methionine biosynthesis protein MetW [Tepidamorphus gemmatus]TCT11802.1 methionine biosynthesis protein MetW [Tepidamorphus gemmatus]